MLLKGKPLADKIYSSIKEEISKLQKKPKLGVILVGENEESLRYIRQKDKHCKKVGIDFELHQLPKEVTQEEIISQIQDWNNDTTMSGYIIQLPLPKHLNESDIIEHISPEKDIDGFHPINQGKLLLGNNSGLSPCTPSGVIHMLESIDYNFSGKNITVVGRSNIVGKPVSLFSINKGATVTVCNSKTKDIENIFKNSDVIIAAAGVPKLIKKEVVQKHTILIDVGFSVVNGKIHGDIDIDSFDNIDSCSNIITPVPGGVGVLTVAFLLQNTLDAYKKQNKINN